MNPTRLLFDSNVFYACINISAQGQHPDAAQATRLMELINLHGCEAWLSDATHRDIDRAKNPALRAASHLRMRQWKKLEAIEVPCSLINRAGYQTPMSANDRVDSHMLAALDAHAVDFLITQDGALRRHAGRAGFSDRVMTIQGGIELLEQLFDTPTRFPTIDQIRAYQIDDTDPIFDSLRSEYPDFDAWFKKARLEQRHCLVIKERDQLDAMVILKTEVDRPHGLSGKVLKICTFKVAGHAKGSKRGELLLKSVFDHARTEDHDQVYLEVFGHHSHLIDLFERFGFFDCGASTARGELVLCKNRKPAASETSLDPLEYHRRFGPPSVLIRTAFVVPIQPRWHDLLFPEARSQGQLFSPPPSGNALLKAYLSRSPIRRIKPGALVMFYRSEDAQAVTAIGVVDNVLRSDDSADIRRFVGMRTVYSDAEIRDQCNGGNVLAILFRYDRMLPEPWALNQLCNIGVLRDAPQAIQQITREDALIWIRDQLGAPQ